VTKKITLLDDYQNVSTSIADWSALTDRYELDAVTDHVSDPAALLQRLAGSEVIVAMRERTSLPRSVLESLPELKLLITTGMNNPSIDIAAANELGITVCGTRGRPSGVSELVMSLILGVTRAIAAEDASIRRGGWQHLIGPGLEGSTLGLIGIGGVGGRVAKLAQAFAMNVIAWTPNLTPERAAEHGVTAVPKDELFRTSDVVSLHAPLSDATRGMVGTAELALMKPTAYLVNTARGQLVDEQALVAALQGHQIAGAALDVYDVEPLPGDHPLRSLPNTLLTPHIGYVTTNAYEIFYRDAVEDVLAFLDGSPVRVLAPRK
jgi:phosphoglycerate dehydrogenase-like enzyme